MLLYIAKENVNIYYMPTIDLYPFSLQGSIADQYGHFFFSVLIPLIVLDHTAPRADKFELKLDVGGFKRILDTLFTTRTITVRPVKGAGPTSFVGDNFDLYITTSRRIRERRTDGRELILDSTEVFDDIIFQHITPDASPNAKRLDALQEKYLTYYYTKSAKYKLTKKESVERKQLYMTHLYHRLIKARPIVLSFFAKRAVEYPIQRNARPILLISRPISYTFTVSIFSAVGGQRRFIWNFAELREAMETVFGDAVETVVLENMNIMEQYVAFHGAQVAVGQHGAGLVNGFFMQRGAHIVEATPIYNDKNNFFKNMARFCELGYTAIPQPGMTPDQARAFFEKCDIPLSAQDSVAQNLAAYYNGEIDMSCAWAVPNEVNLAANSGDVDIAAILRAVETALRASARL